MCFFGFMGGVMKKISLMLMLIMLSVLVLGGCVNDDGANQSSNSNIAMGFYTLQEAYDKGYLNKANLEDIATYINSENVYSELKDDAVVSLIKECATKRIREREIEPVLEAKAEGFTIIGYYGKYADWHVARVRNIYDLHPEDIPDYWREIGGVNFHITSYDMIGCCK